MAKKGFQWSERHWSAKSIPVRSISVASLNISDTKKWFLADGLLQGIFVFAGVLFLAATVYSYVLIASYEGVPQPLNETRITQFWALATAHLALLLGLGARFTLTHRRAGKLGLHQKNLRDKIRALRAAVQDRTTRLDRVETLFNFSLTASRFSMYVQNADLAITWVYNSKFGDMAALMGKCDQEFMPLEAWQQTVKFKRDILKSGTGNQLDYHYSLDGRTIHKRLHIEPIVEAGQVIGMIGIAHDITDQRQRELKIDTLAAELAHRNQNLIAVISAIARQMLKTSDTLYEFEERFTTRLHSIARSFDLIIGKDWQGAPLHDVVRGQIKAVDHQLLDRINISGNDVLLCPEFVEAIGAAIHELTQNALAYGAFAAPVGNVSIDWSIDTDRLGQKQLSFIWSEFDGSDDQPSINRHGYGLNILEKIVPKSLNGTANIVTQPGGIRWHMRCAWKEPVPQKGAECASLNA
jgi:two-component sensor histidine kinase/PAS domain-containing protein